MFDPLKLVTREQRPGDDREWYAADPHIVYPAVIAEIRDDSPAWDDALQPLSSINPDRRAARAACLEKARRWFTAALHRALGGKPLNLHILAGDGHYRL